MGVAAFAPATATIVAEADSARESRACTLALVSTLGDHALHISAVPAWRFDLAMSFQLSPVVETDETFAAEPIGPSVEKNANSKSPVACVVKPETVMDELAPP
jgi:hypothetical protein